jgi:acid phosphatase family membrane protein YuiD
MHFFTDSLFAADLAYQVAPPGAPKDDRGLQVILAAFLGMFIAQALKIFTTFIRTRRVDLRVAYTTGGMPSSHSCSVTAMAFSVGLIEGWNSISFAIALSLALIVMYDAAGVRRSVGLQAKVMNQVMEELFSDHPRLSSERIKELLGHTPLEVFAGAALGCLIAYTINNWALGRF